MVAGEQSAILENIVSLTLMFFLQGRNMKGEEGLFPATYISEDDTGADKPSEATEPAQALANGTHDDHPVAAPSNGVVEKGSPSTQHDDLAIPPAPTGSKSVDEADAKPALLPPVSPEIPAPESPRGGRTDSLPVQPVMVPLGTGAVAHRNGGGDNRNGIDSDEEELGIGQDTRARLAEQAKLANEHREANRASGGIEGLVYSDESDDEDDDGRRRSARASQGKKLEPALPLPATPVMSSNKRPTTWTVDEVVEWARSKAFDEGIADKFRGEC